MCMCVWVGGCVGGWVGVRVCVGGGVFRCVVMHEFVVLCVVEKQMEAAGKTFLRNRMSLLDFDR